MGKTTPTYRDMFESQIENWGNFRRGLRKRRQGPFDEVTRQMRLIHQAGGMQNSIDPTETMFLSLFISYERRISQLEQTVERLEAAVEENTWSSQPSKHFVSKRNQKTESSTLEH